MAETNSEYCSNDSPILLANFKNGNIIPSRRSKLKFICYKKDGNNDESTRILVANNKRLNYVGSNLDLSTSKITSSVLKVCVLNKKRSSVKLYNADFLQLKPHLRCRNVIDVNSEKSYIEKSSDLTLAFGSKIQQKKMNINKKYNSMNMDSEGDILSAMIKISTQDSGTVLTNEKSTSSVIPPQNSSAVIIEEVYNTYDIISKEEFAILDSEASVFLDVKPNIIHQWKSEDKYPSFILQFLEYNLSSMDMYKAKLLCYMNYMFTFITKTYADWKRKEPIPISQVPEPFRQNLMETFTINKKMPMRLKDKLLAYTLVLGLKLNSYCINGSNFAASVKINFQRIMSIAYALGCHVSGNKSDSVKMIQLKLPLYKQSNLPKKWKK